MPFRRVGAFCVDYGLILIWMAGLALAASWGWIGISVDDELTASARWFAQAQAFLMLTLPVYLYFTFFEMFGGQATLGKRLTKIRLKGTALQIAGRNVLKFMPWEIAHTAIWHGMEVPFASEPTAAGWALFILSLSLSSLYLASLFIGSKIAVYDRIAGSRVVKTF